VYMVVSGTWKLGALTPYLPFMEHKFYNNLVWQLCS
jgi:hypothetical protein